MKKKMLVIVAVCLMILPWLVTIKMKGDAQEKNKVIASLEQEVKALSVRLEWKRDKEFECSLRYDQERRIVRSYEERLKIFYDLVVETAEFIEPNSVPREYGCTLKMGDLVLFDIDERLREGVFLKKFGAQEREEVAIYDYKNKKVVYWFAKIDPIRRIVTFDR